MIDKEFQELINELDIIIKKQLRGLGSGERLAKKRGSGLTFDQLRDYEPGDDVRTVDWAGYARTGKLCVRSYHEEQSYPITIVLDCSFSLAYGSQMRLKYHDAVRCAMMIAIAAEHTKQPFELMMYDCNGLRHIPLAKGRNHLMKILTVLSHAKPDRNSTIRFDIFTNIQQHIGKNPRALYCISDFFGNILDKSVAILSQLHALNIIRVIDPLEYSPPLGTLSFVSRVSGNMQRMQLECSQVLPDFLVQQNSFFNTYSIPVCTIRAGDDWIKIMIDFLHQRTFNASSAF